MALRATADPKALGRLAACAGEVSYDMSAAVEEACVRTWLESFIPRAYRRSLDAGEIDEFLALHRALRVDADFPTSLTAIIEAMLVYPRIRLQCSISLHLQGNSLQFLAE